MGIPKRTLKRSFALLLALSCLGAVLLLEPHCEFAVFDLLEKLRLPAPLLGTLAFYTECALLAATLFSGIALVVRRGDR